MGYPRTSLNEWEQEHRRMMQWAKKTNFNRFTRRNALSGSKAKHQKERAFDAAPMDESREALKTRANPWENLLDKWGNAGIIWAHICKGTDDWMHELLTAWTEANLHKNQFAFLCLHCFSI